ncbi:MAG: hypothetical protein J6W35_03770 [Eubacterium sp.]|nr:hypothetical protein [Eubacterium sp.]
MKRLISFALVVMMIGLLAGCSCGEKKSEQETTTIAWVKGESLFHETLRGYASLCQINNKKGIKAKQKLTTGFGEVAKEKNLNKRIGYTFADLNGDGTEELLVSLVDMKDKLNNYIIAAYQYTGDGVKRLLEGWSKNAYYLMKDKLILNQASGGEDDAEISKLHMRDGGFEYVSTLAMKYNKKGKINYLYAEVGKPENTKQFQVSKKFWQDKCKEWEDQVDVNNVKLIKDFKH